MFELCELSDASKNKLKGVSKKIRFEILALKMCIGLSSLDSFLSTLKNMNSIVNLLKYLIKSD